jgi:hypothetical protein
MWIASALLLTLITRINLASEETCVPRSDSYALSAALEYLDNNQDAAQQDVLQLVKIPSLSSMPQYKESVREAGQWLVRRLRRAGLEVSFWHFP